MAKLRMDIKRADVHIWVRWFVESCRDESFRSYGKVVSESEDNGRSLTTEPEQEAPVIDSENTNVQDIPIDEPN
jgi:hypothetical protein